MDFRLGARKCVAEGRRRQIFAAPNANCFLQVAAGKTFGKKREGASKKYKNKNVKLWEYNNRKTGKFGGKKCESF